MSGVERRLDQMRPSPAPCIRVWWLRLLDALPFNRLDFIMEMPLVGWRVNLTLNSLRPMCYFYFY
jgi:hypothetical protein